jgi:hypothetical protein
MLTRKLSSRRIAACGILLIVAAGANISSRRIEGASSSAGALPVGAMPATDAIASTAVQGQGQSEFIQTIRVFIHPEDLYPGIVTVRPGKVRLVAENETLTDVSLVVERVSPGQARQTVAGIRTVDPAKRDRQELTLGTGEYVFYEESRPQQQGRIIVDPNIR